MFAGKKMGVQAFFVHLLPLILALITGALISYLAGQDQNWDLLNYHFYDAFAFLNHRAYLDFAPAGIQTFNNPLVDLLPYLFFSHLPTYISGMLLGAIQGLNLWLIYELCLLVLKRYIKSNAIYTFSFLIAFLSFFAAGNLSEMGSSMGDNTTGIFVLSGLLLLLLVHVKNYTKNKTMAINFLSYACFGIAAGLKLTNTVYLVAALCVELMNWSGLIAFLKKTILNLTGSLVGIIISYGFWGIYLYDRFANPIFPFYNHLFKSKYYPLVNFSDPRFFPHSFLQWVFYPFYFMHTQHLAAEVFYRYDGLAFAYASVLILLFAFLYKKVFMKNMYFNMGKPQRIVLFFITLGYILWLFEFSIYRYLIPLELLSILVVVIVSFVLIKRVGLVIALSLLLGIVIIATVRPMNWGRAPWQKSLFIIKLPYEIQDSSVILMSYSQPVSFLVPSFPKSVPSINIDSSLSSVNNPHTPTQQFIRSMVKGYLKSDKTFYAIETSPNKQIEVKAFAKYGFTPYSCKQIGTNVTAENITFYLCKTKYLLP